MRIELVSTVLLAACSSNPLAPGAGSDPGGGTATILVTGGAHAEPNAANVTADTSFTTNFDLRISLNGQPITTGTVTIASRTVPGGSPLVYENNTNQSGHWTGQVANYDEVYELNVTSGPDKITGVYVDGPDIHSFTAPLAGASLDVTVANTVTWVRNDVAQVATISVGDRDGLTIDDSGTYSMPALSLKYEKDQVKPNTIRLTRSNSIVPKGGAAGSMFTVSVSNEQDVVALACATCP